MKNHRISSTAIVFFLLAGIITACTSTRKTTRNNSGAERTYSRQITPFPVFDEDGNQVQFPFLGGLNTPRPQFVDIDGDRDPDLFLQEQTDDLMFFEFEERGAAFPLVWKTHKYRNLDVGEWFKFVDLDQDGDPDLLTEQPYSYIRYYRNDGSAAEPDFVLAADSLRDITGTPLFSDRQNIPNITDIDCDNRLDLFIGSLDGTLARYESQGQDAQGIPRFELVTKRFQDIEIVKQFGTMHGANSMTFVDIDNDGDQDVFWGDFFEPGILLLENTGSCSNPRFVGEPRPFPTSNPVQTSGYNVPSLADWGQDGDMDLFLGVLGGAYNTNETTAENFYYFEQVRGQFSLETKQFLSMLDVGDESIPAIGDIDGDGDQDLLLANKIDPADQQTSVVYIYENRGTVQAPEFYKTGSLDLPNAYHWAPVLADLNEDGLADLLLGNWKGQVAYYRNTGDGFEMVTDVVAELQRGSNAVPELGDLDRDGDLDLIVGMSGGGVEFFRNHGSSSAPDFVAEPEVFEGLETGSRSAPALTDYDRDGDMDLFIGSKIDGWYFFRNEGSATVPEFVREEFPFRLENTQLGSPRFADLDGDGEVEFISGTRGGGLLYYRP